MNRNDKIKYMRRALELAGKAKGRTYPNPMVGAVIVKNGRIVGEGYHRKAGGPHAEVAALREAGKKAYCAEMFVTLEPCAHFGKTPPCAPAIVSSGIKKVYIAMEDPNPITGLRGIKELKKAGIAVDTGICGEESAKLNRKYVKFITKGLPYVTVKLAQSLDGKIAAGDGSSKWITSKKARAYAKKMRSGFDAVLIGSGTALADDPFLLDIEKKGYGTRRVVVDSGLKLPLSSNLVKTARKAPLVIAVNDLASGGRIKKFAGIKGVELIVLKNSGGRVPLRKLLRELARRGIVNVMVEGGGEIVGSLLDERLVDEWMFFLSPCVLGGKKDSVKGKGIKTIGDMLKLHDMSFEPIGDDILVKGTSCSRG